MNGSASGSDTYTGIVLEEGGYYDFTLISYEGHIGLK
jgi:hypothetical protein